MCCVFTLCGLIVFMVYWAATHSEPFQTSKIEFFVKIVTSNEITSLLWERFWIHLCWMQSKLLGHVLLYIYIYIYIYIYTAVYFMFEITCIFCHFNTIRFSFETLSISGLRSLRSCIYTVTFREMNILGALLKSFLGNRSS